MLLLKYFPEFVDAVVKQLESDDIRWGMTWGHRPREGQELRAFARFQDYLDQYRNAGTPIPWTKVVGEALICWVRENHPELLIHD